MQQQRRRESTSIGQGVHGVQQSEHGVVGNCTDGTGVGVWGSSKNGEGVHGETNSGVFAAVAGIQLNQSSTGAGVYGEHRGTGPAGFFVGNVGVTGNLTVDGDIFVPGADCAEHFEIAGFEKPSPEQ